jgi:hypothetical protein
VRSVVALAVLRDLGGLVGEVGELVHDCVRIESDNRLAQRRGVVDVADHRLRPERAQRGGLAVRTRHPGQLVSAAHQQGQQPNPDHAAGAGEEDPLPHRPRAMSVRGAAGADTTTSAAYSVSMVQMVGLARAEGSGRVGRNDLAAQGKQ